METESNSIEFDLEKFKIAEVISQKIQSNEAIYFDEELNVIDEFTQISQLPVKNINFLLKEIHH